MKQDISSTTPYPPSVNSKKSWSTKSKKRFVSEEEKARIKRDKQVMARFDELGYCKGDNGNLPCFVASWTKTQYGGCPTARAELITYSAQDVRSEYLNQTLRRH